MVSKNCNKTFIRKKYLKLRKKKKIIKSFNFFPVFELIKKFFSKKKIVIAAYYPYNYEVDIIEFVRLANIKNYKTVLPVIYNKNNMKFKIWNFRDPLQINRFGILEPYSLSKNLYPDCLLVPLVVYDSNLNRIGYGKGFYDKVLYKIKKKKNFFLTIGVAYSFQKTNKIPANKHDYKLDYILTEKGIISKKEF